MKFLLTFLPLIAAVSAVPYAVESFEKRATPCMAALWLYSDSGKGGEFLGGDTNDSQDCIPTSSDQTSSIEKIGKCTCLFYKGDQCSGDKWVMGADTDYIDNLKDVGFNDVIKGYRCFTPGEEPA